MPSTLTEIGDSSFRASGIASIIFNNNIETIESFAFRSCNQLKEVNLVEVKIKTLEYGTFSYCNLENIYLPKLLIKMEEMVFCDNPLKNIFCYSNNQSDLFDFSTKKPTFKNVDIKECIVHVPKEKTTIYKIANGWSDFNLIIDDSQKFISRIDKLFNFSKYLNL